MPQTYESTMAEVLAILQQLADDWEYEGTIGPETRLLGDLGFESLEVVVLGATLQRHFGQQINFSVFLAEIGQRPIGDVTVGEWVDFIHSSLATPPAQLAEREAVS